MTFKKRISASVIIMMIIMLIIAFITQSNHTGNMLLGGALFGVFIGIAWQIIAIVTKVAKKVSDVAQNSSNQNNSPVASIDVNFTNYTAQAKNYEFEKKHCQFLGVTLELPKYWDIVESKKDIKFIYSSMGVDEAAADNDDMLVIAKDEPDSGRIFFVNHISFATFVSEKDFLRAAQEWMQSWVNAGLHITPHENLRGPNGILCSTAFIGAGPRADIPIKIFCVRLDTKIIFFGQTIGGDRGQFLDAPDILINILMTTDFPQKT